MDTATLLRLADLLDRTGYRLDRTGRGRRASECADTLRSAADGDRLALTLARQYLN